MLGYRLTAAGGGEQGLPFACNWLGALDVRFQVFGRQFSRVARSGPPLGQAPARIPLKLSLGALNSAPILVYASREFPAAIRDELVGPGCPFARGSDQFLLLSNQQVCCGQALPIPR